LLTNQIEPDANKVLAPYQSSSVVSKKAGGSASPTASAPVSAFTAAPGRFQAASIDSRQTALENR
jgi:hypothetical protein